MDSPDENYVPDILKSHLAARTKAFLEIDDAKSRKSLMGESGRDALRIGSARFLELQFRDSRIISSPSLPAYRDLDEAMDATAMAKDLLDARRTGDSSLPQDGRIAVLVGVRATWRA